MCRDYRLALAGMVCTLAAALPTMAQDPSGQPDAIEQLQAKNVLTDEDQAALRAWVDERVRLITAGEAGDSAKAAQELRGSRALGTQSFKDAYAAVTIEVIGEAYKQAKRDSAARLIALLNTLNEVSAHPLLIEALRDKRVPVRTAAVIGLRHLQKNLAKAGGTFFSETITALREAGKRETSPVTLQQIYRAMDYTEAGSNPDPKANAAAVLALLEARGEQYGARKVKAEGADRPGLELAGKLVGQMDEPERQRLIVTSAKMLHYAVTRYTSELHKIRDKTSSPLQIALRNRMELFIATAETLLSNLTPPPEDDDFKTVTAEMQDQETDAKATYMTIAMNTWSDLLQERFQFDVHTDVAEDAEGGSGDAEGEAPEP